ncbi:hypothetical protein TTRE_0000399601 [Trichuris trichiura]|uniref:Uncharacterized protein n=1 Tax=Trichuris trichiura TaxID=36087 RepID=A0A077Z7Y6_TRITR|nr:hypothetical protein TTRE_0000399601 [Trichuris trichiura]
MLYIVETDRFREDILFTDTVGKNGQVIVGKKILPATKAASIRDVTEYGSCKGAKVAIFRDARRISKLSNNDDDDDDPKNAFAKYAAPGQIPIGTVKVGKCRLIKCVDSAIGNWFLVNDAGQTYGDGLPDSPDE